MHTCGKFLVYAFLILLPCLSFQVNVNRFPWQKLSRSSKGSTQGSWKVFPICTQSLQPNRRKWCTSLRTLFWLMMRTAKQRWWNRSLQNRYVPKYISWPWFDMYLSRFGFVFFMHMSTQSLVLIFLMRNQYFICKYKHKPTKLAQTKISLMK